MLDLRAWVIVRVITVTGENILRLSTLTAAPALMRHICRDGIAEKNRFIPPHQISTVLW
jgi:hypothetical protein